MNIKKYLTDNKSTYRKIWVVAFPIIMQNVLDAAVNSVDVLMLNYVGQSAISAVSLANSMIGILFIFLRNGRGSPDACGTVLRKR